MVGGTPLFGGAFERGQYFVCYDVLIVFRRFAVLMCVMCVWVCVYTWFIIEIKTV